MRPRCFWRLSPHLVLVWGALAFGVLAVLFTVSLSDRRASAEPDRQTGPFTLASPDFMECSPLPQRSELGRLGCNGRNLAPALHWTAAPPGTRSFALTMTDHDAPVAGGFHHWVVYNIPADADWLNGFSRFTSGLNSFGFPGYGGPCPPEDGQSHHYIFTLYALSAAATLEDGLTYDELLSQISPDVIGATVTIGTFVRR
jgi:Raf kinase inhibitor-like YbhB/YbcL family protein